MWHAWICQGRQALVPSAADASVALVDALTTLLERRLDEIGTPALRDRCHRDLGATPTAEAARAWRDEHRAEGFATVRRALPHWGELLDTVTRQWVEVSAEFLRRLDTDRALLHGELGLDPRAGIVEVACPGDHHDGGRAVLVLRADDGTRVVYKPRPVGAEVLVARAARHLRDAGGVDVDLVPHLVDRGTYGWVEHVEARAPRDRVELDRYLRRAGALVVLARAMHVADLHAENVVVAGDRPVAVDLECLAHPAPARLNGDPAAITDDPLVRTLLLPRATEPEAHGLAVAVPGASPPSLAPLLEGIERARRTIAARGLGVALDSAVATRVVTDHTRDFERVLRSACRARHLVDEATFAGQLRIGLATLPGSDQTDLHTAVDQLARLDIPVCRSTTTTPTHGVPGGIGDPATGAERVARTVARLADPADAAFVADVVRISWDQRYGPTVPAPPTHVPTDETVDVVAALADHLARRAMRWNDGTTRWVEAEVGRDGLHPTIGDRGLYGGAAGIAWFLAAAAVATGDERSARLARRAVAPGADEPRGPGLGAGRAGMALSRLVVGRLLDDQPLVRRGEDELASLAGAEHHGRFALDWLDGRSGVVGALGAAAAVTGSDRLAEHCVGEAHRLREAWRQARERGGADMVAATRLGAAHGTGGILLAAGRAHSLAGDPRLGEWAAELVAAENARIAARDGVASRRTRPLRTPEPGWCWGVGGHLVIRRALARWTTLDALDAHTEVAAAIAATARPATSHLCCGAAAVVAALDRDSPAHAAAVRRLVGDGRVRGERGTTFPGHSLFRGVAGVGLTLLRTIDARTPDPLTLDLDPDERPEPDRDLGPDEGRRAVRVHAGVGAHDHATTTTLTRRTHP